MKYDLAINNVIILSRNNDYIPFVGAVGITGEFITYVGKQFVSLEETNQMIDGLRRVLMPGLINGHCHGDMTMARGLGEGMTLWDQNLAFSKHQWFKEFTTVEDRFYSRQLTYIESLLNGTTFILENMYWDLDGKSVEAMAEIGIMGALALDIRKDFLQPEDFIDDKVIDKFICESQKHDLIPVIGSVSEEDFNPILLKKISDKLNQFDVLNTCHLAENDWRVALIEEKYQMTPVSFLSKNGKFDSKTIGSHVVKTTPKDIETLQKNSVSVINTPICEMKIADGWLRGVELMEAGVNVGLGTDGALWNNNNDIFEEMKQTLLIQSMQYGPGRMTSKHIIDMATYNGAKAFGVEDKMGSIEVGKLANFILIDIDKPHLMPQNLHPEYENITTLIVTQINGRDVTDVFIKGNHIVENRCLNNVDVNKIKRKVQQVHEKIINNIGR